MLLCRMAFYRPFPRCGVEHLHCTTYYMEAVQQPDYDATIQKLNTSGFVPLQEGVLGWGLRRFALLRQRLAEIFGA
jgi:hypothetical protein